MKILMVTMSMNIGGAETHILELCRELMAMGHHVTLASNGGVYADELEKLGVRHETLPLNSKSPQKVIEAYFGLKKLIERENFDLVHAHARIPAFICGLLWNRIRLPNPETGKKDLKFRFVTTAHLNFSVNPLWRKISRWGERTMAVSEDIAEYLVDEYDLPRDKIHLTINGVDTKKFSPDTDITGVLKQNGLKRENKRIVYMSRLDADRADPAYRLLNIAEALHSEFPDTDIVIVGAGSESERIGELVYNINLRADREFVKLTGAVSNTNEYCAAADVFIGVSRSALEAMAAAKPVIMAGNQGSLGVFDESKIEAAVDTNFCCRGHEIAAEEDLHRQIAALLSEKPEKIAEMGRFNREFIEKNYTSRRMAEDYTKMYAELLDSPAPFFGKADVVVSGYYGFGNLGDESLLDIIAALLAKEKKNLKITALTKYPKADAKRTGLRCAARTSPMSILYNVGRAKLLISGGGSLLQDATSKRSPKYYAGVIHCAQLMHTKTALFANGVGPIGDESNRKLIKKVLSRADHISVRDPESKAELERIGVSREINVRADPAFLIEKVGDDRLKKIKRECRIPKDYFVVSIRPMPQTKRAAQDVVQRNLQKNNIILKQTAEFCVSIARKYNLTPVILPMQESQDKDLCEMAEEEIRNNGVNAVVYSPKIAGELIGVLADAKFVIGMRLHAVIFASSAGVPVIGLSYDPKVSAMMHALDQPYSVELNDEANIAKKVEEAADEVMQNYEKITSTLKTKAEEMRDLCRKDVRDVISLIK